LHCNSGTGTLLLLLLLLLLQFLRVCLQLRPRQQHPWHLPRPMLMVVETERHSKLPGVLASVASAAGATVAGGAPDEPALAAQVGHEHVWHAQVCHQLGEKLHCSQDSSTQLSPWHFSADDLREQQLRGHCGPCIHQRLSSNGDMPVHV
jgi:hypothetical protein